MTTLLCASVLCMTSCLPIVAQARFVSDIAIFVLKRDVKLQLTNSRPGKGDAGGAYTQ